MSKLLLSAAITAIALFTAAAADPAFAAVQADVTPTTTQIGGNVSVTATVNGAQTNLAVGSGNTQRNTVCTTYQGSQISGNLNATCTLNGAQTNLAIGSNNQEDNVVSAIGVPQ